MTKRLEPDQRRLLVEFEKKLSEMIVLGFEVSALWGKMDEEAWEIVESEYPLDGDFVEKLNLLIDWRDYVEEKLK